MHGRGDTSERRTFAVVMAVVFGSVLTMMLVAPGDDANAALAAAAAKETERDAVAAVPEQSDLAQPEQSPGRHETMLRREQASPEPLAHPRLAGWVNDLRDDHIRGNACLAMSCLCQMPPGEIPELVAALDAPDLQLRHLAAGVLRCRWSEGKTKVCRRLLQVSVDALRSDLGAVARAAYATWIGSLRARSACFLRSHTAAASSMLLRELTSTDAQQRFLSAYLLAQGGEVSATRNPQALARVAYELVAHLGDNKIEGDAMMATRGLFCLGDTALPILLDNRRYLDEQGRKLVDLIRMDLHRAPRTKSDLYARSAMVKISQLYHDPAVQYDMRRSVIPRFRGQ